MPASINQDQFEKIVANQKVDELRVRRIERGASQGHMKLKLRTPRRLYTLYLKDPGVAKTLVKAAGNKNIQIVKYKHGKRV